MNQHGCHVYKFGGDVHIQFTQLFDISQVLRGDARDRNIVDIDILLANQVEQQVKGSFVNIADGHGEGEVALRFRLRHLHDWSQRTAGFRLQARGCDFQILSHVSLRNRATCPWPRGLHPWSSWLPYWRARSLPPEYPTPGVDCPHISFAAPAWD